MNAELMGVGQLALCLFLMQASAMCIGVMVGYLACRSKMRGLVEEAEDRGYALAKKRYEPVGSFEFKVQSSKFKAKRGR